MARFTTLLLALPLALGATVVEAAVLRVPGNADTVQAAIAIANPGDTIEVGAGRWCGAVIDKRLNLVGRGDAVIVGNKDGVTCGPALLGTHRIGFLLSSAAASGTTVRHFTFDGSSIASDPSALALAVYGRDSGGGKVNDVRIEHNKVLGTFQAFTNRGGDDWVISHNEIRGLTATSTGVGGFGIVIMAQSSTARPQRASVTHNRIEGTIPSSLGPGKWFEGVHVASADGTEVAHNRFDLERPEAHGGAALGAAAPVAESAGVLVTNGFGPGSQAARVTKNDGQQSDYVVVVTGSGGTNTAGLVLRDNRGKVVVEGQEWTTDDHRDRRDVAEARDQKDDSGRHHRGGKDKDKDKDEDEERLR